MGSSSGRSRQKRLSGAENKTAIDDIRGVHRLRHEASTKRIVSDPLPLRRVLTAQGLLPSSSELSLEPFHRHAHRQDADQPPKLDIAPTDDDDLFNSVCVLCTQIFCTMNDPCTAPSRRNHQTDTVHNNITQSGSAQDDKRSNCCPSVLFTARRPPRGRTKTWSKGR